METIQDTKTVLDPESRRWLATFLGNNVKFNESMSRHTSLRVGGPAEAFVVPECLDELVELIKWIRQKDFPYLIIGDGTNLLVKDGGIQGLVIVLTKGLKQITQTDTGNSTVRVTAMAGARMRTLCAFAIKHGLKGMNFALGIPGTVGGSIMMNAGTAWGAVEDVLDAIKVLMPMGRIKIIKREELEFGYRKFSWRKDKTDNYHGQPVILDGSFCLQPSDSFKLKKEAEAILKTRGQKQPQGFSSAGCFFKNPLSGKTAGELIELAGLKNKRIGGAAVSPKHANFMINRSNASATDFLALMELVQETVFKMFGVYLQPEVKIVGE